METELQECYILHVCAKELLAESERAISATVPQCTDSDRKRSNKIKGKLIHHLFVPAFKLAKWYYYHAH
jgi:hypothetical protein